MESGLYIVVYEIGNIYNLRLATAPDMDTVILFDSEESAKVWAEENGSWDYRIFEWEE
jgi:hypothetical protein